MKDNFVQFLRKYKIALCAGITCVLVLVAVAAGVRGAVSAQAENSSTPSILNLLDGKQHPYMFVNEEYIEELKSLKDNEYYAPAYLAVSKKANAALPSQPEDGILSGTISRQLEAKAFMYMLGELSEVDAQETIAYTIEYLKNAKSAEETKQPVNTISLYKDYGTQAIQTGALVYDWCYDIMTQNQRTELASYVKEFMYADYQPCRPDNMNQWYDIADKAVGQPLIYNSIAAVALYDAYPELYNTIMPKVLGTMAEIVKIYGEAGALSDGSISYTREYYAYYVAVMLDRLGYDHELFYGDQVNIGYKMLYSRLPYGALIKQGDDFNQQTYAIGQYVNMSETREVLAMLSAMYNEPYLKFQFIKENPNSNGLFSLLRTSSEIEPELPDELPLAFEVGEPKSEIMARTSWQDGLDSPAVVAYMNMNNRRTGDHDHSHMGEFQLYYKGPLTMSSGLYAGSGWGGTHWRNYYTRSISANCVTVYDLDEVHKCGGINAEANDGGQKGATAMWRLETNMSDANYLTETEATFIGPNKNTPAFSYIKGNLTNSDDKMASYKRAMVFMDTFNEEYPGVMIVFDRVVSTNADFQKKWLLQAVTEPVVEGNKITITNTDEGCNGKLVNTTLYPQSVNIATVGGIGEFISDGQEWPIQYSQTMSDAYISGFRCEVSPTTAATEDIFLNAMYVTDADGNVADLPMTRVTTDEFMGVATLDRQVMFSKSGEEVSTVFSVNVVENGYEEVICLLTDVAAGKWTVAGNGMNVTVEATEKEGSLVFTARPGDYTVTPADAAAETTDVTWEEAEKEKIGDFTIKMGTIYTYVKNPNRVVDGKPYIAIADFMERFLGAATETNGKTLTVILKNGNALIFNAGSKEYTMKNGDVSTQGMLIYEPFLDANGVFYLNCSGISHHLGFNVNYSEKTKVMQIAVLLEQEVQGVDSNKVLWPVAITASTDDGHIPENLIDRNLNGESRWSSVVADGEWVCFDLGAEMNISSVQIAFYNEAKENKWNFDIQVSSDGITFTDVLTGMKSDHTTKDMQFFELPEGTKARYVRYVGHGVHRKDGYFKGYYNSVTEFRINK